MALSLILHGPLPGIKEEKSMSVGSQEYYGSYDAETKTPFSLGNSNSHHKQTAVDIRRKISQKEEEHRQTGQGGLTRFMHYTLH